MSLRSSIKRQTGLHVFLRHSGSVTIEALRGKLMFQHILSGHRATIWTLIDGRRNTEQLAAAVHPMISRGYVEKTLVKFRKFDLIQGEERLN